MLRELAIVICAASIVSTDHLQDSAAKDQLTQSPTSVPTQVPSKTIYEAHQADAQPQAKTSSPTVTTYQNVAASHNTYLPSKLVSYEVKPAVVETLGTIGPDTSKNTLESYGSANGNQQIVYSNVAPQPRPVSVVAQYFPTPATYTSNASPVRPYYAVPVAAKTVTVESQAASNAHSPSHASHQFSSAVRPYYTIPVAPKPVSVEAQGAVASQPVAYATYRVNSPVQYVNNVVAAKPYYSVPVAPKTVAIESYAHAHFPAVAYPVPYTKTVEAQPVTQYVSSPVKYVTNPAVKTVTTVPVATKNVAVESNSVYGHHQYVPAPQPQLVRYAPVTVPKPVPLVYQATGVETHHPATQQFTLLTKTVAPTAPTYKQEQVKVQPIPVPVEFSPAAGEGIVRFHPVSVPVVHSKSFVEKVYAPVGPTPTPAAPAGHEYVGYARAVAYSPASAVSRVTFNGLGVSYGW